MDLVFGHGHIIARGDIPVVWVLQHNGKMAWQVLEAIGGNLVD